MSTRFQVVPVFVLSLAATLCVESAFAAPPSAASGPELQLVRREQGPAWFEITQPDAAWSPALRINHDLADKEGRVPPPTRGWIFTNRVIVGGDEEAALVAVLRERAFAAVKPVEGAPGFWIVQCETVRHAMALADELASDARVREAWVDAQAPRANRALPTDPGFASQWHLRNTTNTIADINVEPAWNAGYTGTGITVGILEGGFQTNHTDLAANYNSTASQTGGSNTSHGTSCAGLSGAVANNGKCGVGVAYTGKVSKLLYGTSSTTATAFGYRNDLNHIKSNSWGPADNGLITYLSSVERTAIDNAIATGRGGKGTIFAWAAGNGGTADRCDYDPYASNRKVMTIGAVGDQDTRSSFNETGSSMLVVAHSSGNVRGIYTTNSSNRCTSSFGGTSAACPIGAGSLALVLQANPNLTWRDVQHVLVNAARKCDPANSLWTLNGAGHDINYNYGCGAIDVWAAIQLAAGWTNVPSETSVQSAVLAVNTTIPDNNTAGVTRTFTTSSNINVENVEIVLNATMTYVGDLQIVLTSPSGTQSLLAGVRADATDNYTNYVFTTRRCWDESSAGTWSLNISDRAASDVATWTNWQIKIYGTP